MLLYIYKLSNSLFFLTNLFLFFPVLFILHYIYLSIALSIRSLILLFILLPMLLFILLRSHVALYITSHVFLFISSHVAFYIASHIASSLLIFLVLFRECYFSNIRQIRLLNTYSFSTFNVLKHTVAQDLTLFCKILFLLLFILTCTFLSITN